MNTFSTRTRRFRQEVVCRHRFAGSIVLLVVALAILAPSALSAQEISSIFDPNFDKAALRRVERTAIIPNRLPLVLQEPARSREVNWEKLDEELRENGFAVLP